MLTRLRIENFAIIDQLELEFGDGMIVFTGETGAGKSIILDALDVVLGGRADLTMIRSGAERATVEGEFGIAGPAKQNLIDLLRSEDLLDDERFLTIGREIRREGRTVTRINGRSASSSLLKDLASLLIDIHGQTEHLSIFNTRTHIELLDRFANLGNLKSEFLAIYTEHQRVQKELNTIREVQANAANRQDMLRFQLDEINKANLKPGEEISNKQERDKLANAEALSKIIQQAGEILEEGGFESTPVIDQVGNLSGLLHSLAKFDPSNQELSDRCEAIVEMLNDLSHDLRIYGEGIEFNPQRLEQLENRIDLVNQLQKKYGGSIEAVTAYQMKAAAELETIATGDERIGQLEQDLQQLMSKLTAIGEQLTQQRKKAASILAENVERELDDLKMTSAKFQIQIDPFPQDGNATRKQFDKNGFDSVEFMIAPNMGEGFKPLVKIASGGETSRLMLALKNTLAKEDQTPTLVFDEIDQGIGGRVGNIVGEKLQNLSHNHQVFCITHLPQLAAFGKQHFKVEKAALDGRTTTHVIHLAGEDRIMELAQMFGELTEGTITSAKELLQQVESHNRPA